MPHIVLAKWLGYCVVIGIVVVVADVDTIPIWLFVAIL